MARIPERLPRDVNARAVAIVRIAIGEDEDNEDNIDRGIGMVEKALERKGMIRRWLKNRLAVGTVQQVPPGRVE